MNTQTWYTKGISINSNDILSSFPLHYLIKPFCKLVFLKIFFFWFSKLRVSSHGQIKFVCQTSLNMYVLALCTTTLFFLLNSYLLCMATWCLIQGQSAHLHFILESWFPLVSGADLGANADEHVASANKRSRPLLPLVQTWGLILVPTVVFLFDIFFVGWKYIWK